MPLDTQQIEDPQAEMERLRAAYEETSSSIGYNALIVGMPGSGKTFTATSAVGPIHFDTWDPSGHVTLMTQFQDELKSGKILMDRRWQKERKIDVRGKAQGTRLYDTWCGEMDKRLQVGYFDNLGTYVLDSLTSFAGAVMNAVDIATGKPFGERSQPMWGKAMDLVEDQMAMLASLPCDVIVLGHIEYIQSHSADGIPTGRPYPVIISLGKKLSPKLMKTFSEVYLQEVDDKSKRVLHTHRYGQFDYLKTSLGKLAQQEVPDIKYLLKKAGLPTEDKS